MVSARAFSARDYEFDPRGRRGKISVSEHSYSSFAYKSFMNSETSTNLESEKKGVIIEYSYEEDNKFPSESA